MSKTQITARVLIHEGEYGASCLIARQMLETVRERDKGALQRLVRHFGSEGVPENLLGIKSGRSVEESDFFSRHAFDERRENVHRTLP